MYVPLITLRVLPPPPAREPYLGNRCTDDVEVGFLPVELFQALATELDEVDSFLGLFRADLDPDAQPHGGVGHHLDERSTYT